MEEEKSYHQKIEIQTDKPWALNKMAIHLMNIGKVTESIQYHNKAARKGDGHSQFFLGMFYYDEFLNCDKENAPENFTKCVYWLEKRAVVGGIGNIRAQVYLSEIFKVNGFYEKAEYWCERVSEQENENSRRFFMKNFGNPNFQTRDDLISTESASLLDDEILECLKKISEEHGENEYN